MHFCVRLAGHTKIGEGGMGAGDKSANTYFLCAVHFFFNKQIPNVVLCVSLGVLFSIVQSSFELTPPTPTKSAKLVGFGLFFFSLV